MDDSSKRDLYEELLVSLSDNEGVTITAEGLVIHDKLFAFVDGDDLVVEVTEARAADLTERGVAEAFSSEGHPSRKWVRVTDQQLWPELTREAHEYVGEPAVGGES